MNCTADHVSMKESLATFVLSTHFVAVQVFAGGNEPTEVHYMGNCPVCLSTLSVLIDLPRGSAVKGEIEASDEAPPVRSRYGFDERNEP